NLINNNILLIGSFGFSLIYNDTNDAKIIIIDTMGIIIAQRLFTARNYIKMQSALVVTNGDFIFTGGVIESGGLDIIISRVDSNLYGPPIGIREISNFIPVEDELSQNYPNPF